MTVPVLRSIREISMTKFSTVLITLIAAATTACGRSAAATKPADSTSSSTTVQVSQPVPIGAAQRASAAAGKPACPRNGEWARCSVENRLVQAGFVVRPVASPSPRRTGFSVLPVVYTLGHSRLEVFLYPSAAAVKTEVSQLDTLTAAPRGQKGAWDMPPALVRSANLIAVFLTDSPQQAERLSLAITAGPPQP
jgi:hypothetical protein